MHGGILTYIMQCGFVPNPPGPYFDGFIEDISSPCAYETWLPWNLLKANSCLKLLVG